VIGPEAVGGITLTSKMPGGSYSLPARATCPVGDKLAEVPGTPCFGCYATRGAYAWKPTQKAQHRRFATVRKAIASDDAGAHWVAEFAGFLNAKTERAAHRLANAGAPSPEAVAAYYELEAAGARCSAGAVRIIKGGVREERAECKEQARDVINAQAAWDAFATVDRKRVKAWLSNENARHFRWHDSGDIFDPRYLLLIVAVAENSPGVSHWLPTQERATIKKYLASGRVFPENLTVRISSARVDSHPRPTLPGVRASSVSTTGDAPDDLCPAYTRGGTCGPCRRCWADDENVPYPVH